MIYTVAVVGIIAMFLAYIKPDKFKYGLELAWLVIFVFLAIRYNFGNDYEGYRENFDYFNSYRNFDIHDDTVHAEYGWIYLCRLFSPLGFFGMVIFLTAFECWVYYRLIKKYVERKWQWFAIFIFVFTPSLMLIHASMMRQALATALFVFGFQYIVNRKIIPYVILIYLATTVHASAIILYPVFLLGYIRDIRFYKYSAGLIIIVYVYLLYTSAGLLEYVHAITEFTDMGKYLETYNARTDNVSWGVGAVLTFYIFSYILFTISLYSKEIRLLFLLLVIGFFTTPFAIMLPMVGRLSYYFLIISIVCYPTIVSTSFVSKYANLCRYLASFTIILLTLYSYITFFQNEVWQDAYSTYYTIFSI